MSSALLHTIAPALMLSFSASPLPAQRSTSKPPPTVNAPPAAAGIPQQVLATALLRSVAAFRKSFEVSLDGVHWGTSISAAFPYPCVPGTGSPCASGTPDVRIYTRWIPLPKVDTSAVHIAGMTGPYRIELSLSRTQSVCESGASYPLPSSGFPINIRASRPGASFPIRCTWAVSAVVARPPGSTPAYELVQSNTASVTLILNR
jgi:hypothetical protein